MIKVLHIAKWFPSPQDEQLGVFVEKHVRSAMALVDTCVLHLCPGDYETIRIVDEERNGLRVVRVEYPSDRNLVYKMCRLSQTIGKACKIIEESFGTPDIVHAHTLAQPAIVARRRYSDTPIVLSEHWTGFVNGYYEQLSGWRKKAFLRAEKMCLLTTTPSPFLANAMKSYGFQGPFVTLPNVIEAGKPQLERPPGDKIHFLTVADLHDHNKNISGTLRALSQLSFEIKFDVIGEGEDRIELEDLTEELGLKEHVNFLGRHSNPEVLEKLGQVDCLIVNSRFETFSMITAEALASGTPVIATRCGGPEQFVNENNGILIEKDDQKQLVAALIRLPEVLGRIDREAIHNEFKSRFSPAAVGQQLVDIYQQIIAQRQ